MANTQIDVAAKASIDDISVTSAGTVTNSVRVVIAEGLSKENAYVTLTAIRDALNRGDIVLN